jgi:MoaA/NifB/PqqE/SkfB family radical SAM enzyme
MEWDLYTAIIDEVAPFAEAVVLHSWGEPLLHPRIIEMITYAKERHLRVETSTNATILTEEVSRKLLQSGLDLIYLSMDGLTKETYEKVRVKGKFEEVLANIERFLDLRHELGSSTQADIQMVRLSETDAEVDEFVKRWKHSHARLINIKELDTWGGQINEVNALAVEDSAEDVNANRRPCPNLWYHCHIHWDGVLVSCSRDYDAVTPLGNVRNGGVLATWHGARMRMMRRWHAIGNFCAQQCVDCTEWSWWTPAPFAGGGTGGKATKVKTDEEEQQARTSGNGTKLLPLFAGDPPSATTDACDESCGGSDR